VIPLHWHTEPTLLITLLAAGWIFAVCAGPLRRSLDPSASYPRQQAVLFFVGLLITYLTVGSPLDQLGEEFLFSFHMIQHTLLIYALPVIFLFGTPTWLADRILEINLLRQCATKLVHPVIAGSAFTLCFTLWHVPALYEAALHSKRLHILEHWTMFGTALLMWWSILSPSKVLPAKGYGVRMIFISLLMVGQIPVFGYLTFSGEVLYPTYAFAPRLEFFNVSPLDDQILGGVLMKLANMIVSLIVLGTSFYLWAQADRKSVGTGSF
jgi:putative membrane protein